MVLKEVFYAPGIRRNLISVPALLKKGLEVRFYNNRVSIRKDKKVFAMGKFVPEHDLFCLSVVKPEICNKNSDLLYSSCLLSDFDLWHMRLGHTGNRKIYQIIKMDLLPNLSGVRILPCEHCLTGKMTRKLFFEG